MKRIIRMIICLTVFLMFSATYVYAANDSPDIDITTYDGKSVLIKDGKMFYSSLPVTFSCAKSDGEVFYSISIDEGENYGSYVRCDGSVTLYPDDTTSPDGIWFIKFKSIAEGTEAESDPYKICFDTTPPVIELEDPGTLGNWTNESGSFVFTITDDLSGIGRIVSMCEDAVIGQMCAKEDEVLKEYGFTVDVTDALSRQKTVQTRCYDIAGNMSEYSFEFLMDQSIPELSASGIENGAHLSSSGLLKLATTDSDSDVFIDYTVKRDHGGEIVTTEVFNVAGSADISFSEDGTYLVEASAVDMAGNRSDKTVIGFVIDTTPPTIGIDGIWENADIKGPASITVDVTENIYSGAIVDITLQRTTLGNTENIPVGSYYMQANRDTRAVDIRSDGEYEMTVKATDGTGNVSEEVRRFRIDMTPPEISVSGIDEGEITSASPVLRFSSGELFYDSTIMTTVLEKKEKDGYVRIGGTEHVMVSARDHVDTDVPGEGQFRLTCFASDRSGNSASTCVNFTVDYTPPVIGSLKDIDNMFFRSFTLPRKLASYISDATGVKALAFVNDVKLSEQDVIIEEGKYVLTILAEDEAANVAEESATFIVDHTSPQIVLAGFDRDGNISRGSMITVSLLEEDDILTGVRFNDRDIAIGPDNTAHIAVNEYGTYNIAVTAVDRAGNVTDTEIHTSCYLHSPLFNGYLKAEEIVEEHIKPAENDIDFKGLAVGLFSVMTGTFGLVFRTFLRD